MDGAQTIYSQQKTHKCSKRVKENIERFHSLIATPWLTEAQPDALCIVIWLEQIWLEQPDVLCIVIWSEQTTRNLCSASELQPIKNLSTGPAVRFYRFLPNSSLSLTLVTITFYFCRTPVLGLGLGVDFTFAWDYKNNNKKKNNKNPHLNFSKGTVLGEKEQGVGIRDKGQGSWVKDHGSRVKG